jgi:hypothetical protein
MTIINIFTLILLIILYENWPKHVQMCMCHVNVNVYLSLRKFKIRVILNMFTTASHTPRHLPLLQLRPLKR